MRGYLIFLALVVPVALLSPFFWSTVRMQTSVERVGYVAADGVTQLAWIGPQAPWPDWAPRPEGARMRVQSHFEAAPGRPAIGVADIDMLALPAPALDAYAADAAAAGWSVELMVLDTATPDLPPRPFRLCILEARRDDRLLRLTLERDGVGSTGALSWVEGEAPAMAGARPGRC